MLGKRRKQFSAPAHYDSKRRKVVNNLAPKQFGSGYNPKAISRVKPPANAEVKWYDKSAITAAWGAAGGGIPSYIYVDSLNRIAQGDTGDTRDGNKILVTKLSLRGTCEAYQNSNGTFTSTTPGEVYFRWMVIIDTQANGANPALTDVFESDPTGADQFDIYNSLTETGRYKILMDKFIKVNAACPIYNTNTQHTHVQNRLTHFKKTFNLNLPIVYSDGTSNMAAVRNNNIFMVIFNGHDGSNLGVNYRTRLRFTDY